MKNKYMISAFLILIIAFTFCIYSYATEPFAWEVSSNALVSSNELNSSNTSNQVDSNVASSQTSSNTTLNETSIQTSSSKTSNVSAELEDTVRTNNILNNNSLNLTAGSGILIEQSTGQVLYAHNIHEKLRPASVTKIMSILLIMEALDSGNLALTDKIPCSQKASDMGGSQIWLDTREELTVDEMLKAICVVSANDYGVQ